MPRKNPSMTTLLSLPVPKVPHFEEFVMYLFNNGYSKHTIYNYYRDLVFFALFLRSFGIKFQSLNTRHINFYKGWLKDRQHIKAVRDWFKQFKDTVSKGTDHSKGFLNGKNFEVNGRLIQSRSIDEAAGQEPLSYGSNSQYLKELEAAFGKYLGSQTDSSAKGKDTELEKKPGDKRQYISKTVKGGNYAKYNDPTQLDANSINRMLSALRQYLRFLVEQGYDTPIVADQVKLVRSPKRLPNVPSLEDVLRLVEAPSQLETDPFIAARNRAMLETLLATGMRISELISLNRGQLNREGKLFITGKGNKQRFVYLTARAIRYLEEYLKLRDDPYPALFVPKIKNSRRADPRITASYLQTKIAEYRRVLGIVVPITAHSIRHAFATYMVERGANPAILQRLLGHESLHTTTKYVHLNDIVAEREHQRFHPVKE